MQQLEKYRYCWGQGEDLVARRREFALSSYLRFRPIFYAGKGLTMCDYYDSLYVSRDYVENNYKGGST